MKSRKIQVVFTAENIWAAEALICDILFDCGLKGVICQTPLESCDVSPTDLLDETADSGSDETAVIGYVPESSGADEVIEEITDRLKSLEFLNIRTRIVVETVDDKDWAHAWKEHFHVTRITDQIVVRPTWKSFDPGPGDLVIDLDPGMAFGTGTHPTTVMCIQLIEQFLKPGNNVLDVGTGSGILLLAARLLGASRLTGIDIDQTAVAVSNENLIKNRIEPSCFQLYCTELSALAPEQETFDLVAANILAHVLVDLMDDLKKRTRPGGILILSGIVRERLSEVEVAMDRAGLICVDTRFTDEWVAIAARNPKESLIPGDVSLS